MFKDLAALCASPGFAHAIAYFCLRDHVVGYSDKLKAEEYAKLFSFERLIRTEISTLVGLLVRSPCDFAIPDVKVLEDYIARSESLLKELHNALSEPARRQIQKAIADPGNIEKYDPLSTAEALREPIFYGPESAYSSQYRDLSVQKYTRDSEWLTSTRGFSPEDARRVAVAVSKHVNAKLLTTLVDSRDLLPEKRNILAGFQFTAADIAAAGGLKLALVSAVLDSFTCPEDGNATFTSLNEFNATNAFPILKAGGDNRILFLFTSLTEALYETPFFWMISDKSYAAAASTNRGLFAEEFSTTRLTRVFGADKVFRNVDVWESKTRKKKLGEIDSLVLFGDRAIVIQAKSKKLTLAARKGNDLQLKADFKAAVQDACDQAVACSQHLLAGTSFITESSGKEIRLLTALKKIHPVCVVSDHYPALSFQAQQFLAFKPIERIEQPLVCDVFFMDVVTEFLETPLRMLSYLELRARVANNIGLSHEIVALGYHPSQNLWLGEYDFIGLEDSFSVDVDIAMAARRDGVEGERVPPGILTRLKGTPVGRIIEEIEKRSEPGAIGTGLELLKLGEKSVNDLNIVVDKIVSAAKKDGKPHDATLVLSDRSGGVTIHCSPLPDDIAGSKLKTHCELCKYREKAGRWFGLTVWPGDGSVRFGVMLEFPWKQDQALDVVVGKLPPLKPIEALATLNREAKRPKIGRNALCPCGSGLKYKKCHLPKGGMPS
ncbi:MAG: SEC-C motif family [Planctomycetota bacterium]|nr:MAG: SEC-C motif family [Planctomycetota bacterium]